MIFCEMFALVDEFTDLLFNDREDFFVGAMYDYGGLTNISYRDQGQSCYCHTVSLVSADLPMSFILPEQSGLNFSEIVHFIWFKIT